MANYKREKNVKLCDISLDIENPRFASYFERIGKDKLAATQKDVTDYLRKYESIKVLSERIRIAKGLHPTELLACIKSETGYIVLEGNRRVCACKDLYAEYSQNDNQKELINNITEFEVVVYDTRAAAQPYISDKHIDGVKKWESIEKSCYYYSMFLEKKQLSAQLSVDKIVEDVAKETTASKGDVKDCIIKYGFYMSVYEALAAKHSREALADVDSFLPLVDRFMKTLVGADAEVGLDLPFSELKYKAHAGKEEMLKEILMLVGEAFLVRKIASECAEDELSRINSKEVDKQKQQKNLIKEDKRIPGLLDLIKKYKEYPGSCSACDANEDTDNGSDGSSSDNAQGKEEQNSGQNSNDGNTSADSVFEPQLPWQPKRPQNKTLYFSESEGKAFNLSDSNDEDIKIKFVIAELSRLPVDKFPYSCTALYRTLLEAATKKAYDEKKPKENGKVLIFDKGSLPTAVSMLARNNVLKISESERANIREYIDKKRIIDTLNDYIHNPKQVDTEIIMNSWITMKEYIKACLNIS